MPSARLLTGAPNCAPVAPKGLFGRCSSQIFRPPYSTSTYVSCLPRSSPLRLRPERTACAPESVIWLSQITPADTRSPCRPRTEFSGRTSLVVPGPTADNLSHRRIDGQTLGIEFPVGHEPGIRSDLGTMKLQLQTAFKTDPQRFNHCVLPAIEAGIRHGSRGAVLRLQRREGYGGGAKKR